MAEPDQDHQERNEPASPKRLDDARRRGQVPRSRELATSLLLLAASGAMLGIGAHTIEGLAELMRTSLSAGSGGARPGPWPSLSSGLGGGLSALAPFMAVTAAVALLGPMALGGFNASAEALGPKWDKLDPIKGLQRLFSWRAFMEMAKAGAKFVLLTGATAILLSIAAGPVLGLATLAPEPALRSGAWLLGYAFVALSATTLLIAAVDVPFQLWTHARQLRMSRQEVKEELKQTEGKPEVRGRLRALQREFANRRMLDAVADADVVVTNPDHYACALRYDVAVESAPRLVAKGTDHMAERIRSRAMSADVPLFSSPRLARAIFHHTRLGEPIPVGLYVAVAEVLAYVFRLREGVQARAPGQPGIPAEFEVTSP